MNPEKIHIFFVPGLAANSTIFENIKLPEHLFELHFIEWLVPESIDETLEHYVERMSQFVTVQNAILVGVSFGGVIVQELKKYTNPQKIIIISSIKSRHEMPVRMRFAQKTHVHKMIPTTVFSNIEKYEKYVFSHSLKKRIGLYKKYLSMRDSLYLPWAINAIVNWQRIEVDSEIIHIHGTQDFIFPAKYIRNYYKIENGTHIMILNKAKKISDLLENLILKEI